MVVQDLDYLFTTLDVDCKGYIEWTELTELDESIYHDPLDIEQLEAAIETVCGPNSYGRCRREYFSDMAYELERRHELEEKIKWDFRALDLEDVGRIPIESALFLFKAVLNDHFSHEYWQEFISNRIRPHADISFDEVKLPLCNIPPVASSNSDEEYLKLEEVWRDKSSQLHYDTFKQLQEVLEDDAYMAEAERETLMLSNKLKNNADNLINRMDEIGLRALLEDDFGDNVGYERPKEKVTATELLDALHEKYQVLRHELLYQMLCNHIGEGMWQTLPGNEQQEKLFQLKMKEEKLRKDGKLEKMVIHLPDSRAPVNYNIFSLMGESTSELEKRIVDQQKKIEESGLPMEEVVREFGKKLTDKENMKSSNGALLLDINNRFVFERDVLRRKLQGLSGYQILSAPERENLLFAIVQARLRGMQEGSFVKASISIGLSERVQPRNHDRSAKDPEKLSRLCSGRLEAFKSKGSFDEPVIPPKIYPLKANLGRVDIALQLVQECERRFALEREMLLSTLHSNEVLNHRISARKLTNDERYKQLSVLQAQWQGWLNRETAEKRSSLLQNQKCFEEAIALKFECVKEEKREELKSVVSDNEACVSLLASLQMNQDEKCRGILNIGGMTPEELSKLWKEQTTAIIDKTFDHVGAVIFGIVEISEDEEELLKVLENKYDTLRDKLLMEALVDQFGKVEWERLEERERQNKLLQLKLEEKKLRKAGKYDEISKLMGDAAENSAHLAKMLGENRQRYMNKLQDRLETRKRRISAGEDPDTFVEEVLEETSESSSGNVIEDLEKRFEDERDALLKKLREEHNRQDRERERQAELLRLRLEARKAGQEENFNSAALVLGLAERNKAALEDRLKSDRERQEQLAKERLEARRKKRDAEPEEVVADKIEPSQDDLLGWQDLVLKEVARKHEKERNLFSDMLQDDQSEDLRQEAREMSSDQRQERLNKLREKRKLLDLGVKNDQEEHLSALEMAISIKYIARSEMLKEQGNEDVSPDNIIISLMADLQQLQDEEVRKLMELLSNKGQEELIQLRERECEAQNQAHVEHVCHLLFEYEGIAKDEEIVKALDKKYDVLLDKLALAALEEQLSNAEWKTLSEKERQSRMTKLKLEQKKLLQEGKFDEAARLLGEGFKVDANMKKLMGEQKKKYGELLQGRLAKRRESLARRGTLAEITDEDLGEQLAEEIFDEEGNENEEMDATIVLKDLQTRYNDEKAILLARLHGVDKNFMSEKERQAELARLKHEQRKAQKAEKFDTAAMVLGLAERNKEAVKEKLKNDRTRQELIAKEKLERMRNRRAMKKQDTIQELEELEEMKDDNISHDALMKLMERRHALEGEELVQYLQNIENEWRDQAMLMSMDARNDQLETLKLSSMQADDFRSVINEMAAIKIVNRMETLQLDSSTKENIDKVIVSIMADLQQKQDEDIEKMMKIQMDMSPDEMSSFQKKELDYCNRKNFPQIPNVLSLPEEMKSTDESAFIGALETKYDSLKDKLLLDALEKQMGEALWASLNERERQQKLLQIKLEKKKLEREGRHDEASRLINELLQQNADVNSLLVLSKAEQDAKFKERLERRKQLQADGMSDEDIKIQEDEEDKKFDEEIAERSKGNVLENLEKNYEAERDALLQMLNDSNSKYATERHRQMELSRLRREAKKVKAEEKFNAATLMLGMMTQDQATLKNKLENDRLRQEQLARERLEARRKKKLTTQQAMDAEVVEESIEDTNDLIDLQGNVLKILERRHGSERDLLLGLIHDLETSEWMKKAKDILSVDRQKQLLQLKQTRTLWREEEDASIDQITIFKEAIAMKVAEIMSRSDSKESIDDAIVKVLADLQDSQDEEVAYTTKDLAEKDMATLKQLVEIQQMALQKQWNDNVAIAVLNTKGIISEDQRVKDEVNEALNEKYDALKVKIYEEALKAKFGEEAWNAMSAAERNEHLANMKANEDLNTGDEETHNDLEGVKLSGTVDSSDGKDGNKEEKNANTVLKDLQKQMEEEKAAIMSSLVNAQTKDLNEKERQLALFRLRRDKMRIEREEKYDSAAIIFNMAQQDMANKQASYQNDRARQEELARQKIAARRKKTKEAAEEKKTEYEKLQEEELQDKKEALVTAQKVLREGTFALRADLMNEMEKKQSDERDVLMELIQALSSNAITDALNMDGDDRATKLSVISVTRNKLKDQVRANINSHSFEGDMSETEKKAFDESVINGRSAQLKALSDGLTITVVTKSEALDKEVVDGNLDEEIFVSLMADLQELQNIENNALVTMLAESDRNMIQNLKAEQQKRRRAGYLDNLAAIVFESVSKSRKEKENQMQTDEADLEELKDKEKKFEEQASEQLAELEVEMEEEKKKKLLTLSGEDMEEYLKQLQRQQEMKRQAIQDQLARQREMAKDRLMEKKRKRDDKQYESQFVSAMILDSHKRTAMIREKTMAIQGAQKDSLEERLRRRREERKRKQEEAAEKERLNAQVREAEMKEAEAKREIEQDSKEEVEKMQTEEDDKRKMETTSEEPAKEEPTVKKKKIFPPLPGGGLKREKTVVEKAADISEKKKQETISMLMREQTSLAMKISNEQSRQEELVRRLREKRRKKMEARENEAAALIGLGQRQKTIVEEKKKDERQRQIGSIRERVDRIKRERTMVSSAGKERQVVSPVSEENKLE